MKTPDPRPFPRALRMVSAAPTAPAAADAPPAAPPRLHFGRIELRPAERQLRVGGRSVALGARAFDVLLALAGRAGRLVTKRELLDLVWPDTVVEENNLPAQVSQLRKVLGPDVIATIPGRGYRFVVLPSSGAAAEPSVAALPRVVADAVPAPPRLRTNLPEGLPTLIGRDDDLARLGTLIDAHRLVTLVGAGGMGKTRLAQALLHGRRADTERYPNGVCWIELGAASDASTLPHVIATALGVRPGPGEPLAGLIAALAPLSVLIALDNAEHLLADVALVAHALHEGAARARIVVTSQAPLKLRAERLYRLGPLAVPSGPLPADAALGFGAVALFAERAQAADARFALTDANVADAIRVCHALDGLALAIELAAARAPLLGVRGLAASLHERLRLLTTSADRLAPARQQTLRAALEWSHGFLGEPERRVFRRMAVIAGSASLELLQQVVADAEGAGALDGWAALDALEVLVDRSLVALVGSNDAVAPRYRLLDSPHALAQERLVAAGETEAVRRRHALAVAARFEAAWSERYGGAIGWDDWARALEPDLDNARDAFAWAKETGDAATALAIMPSLVWALRQSLHDEQAVHADACAALADDCEALMDQAVAPGLRVRAWIAMNLVWVKSHPQRAHAAALRAVQLARECGDRFGLYFALGRTVVAHARRRDPGAGEAALAEMLAIEEPDWPPQRRVLRAAAESYCDWRSPGEVTGALDRIRHSLSLYRAAGDGLGTVAGQIYVELGAGDAQPHGARHAQSLARAQLNLGAAWLAIGDAPQARAALQAGWPEAARFDLQAFYADHLALLAALEGRPRTAALLTGHAQARYERLQDARQRNEALAVERARRLACASLTDAEFEQLQADGAQLHDAEIATLAFATQEP